MSGYGSPGIGGLFVRPFGLSDNPFAPRRLPLLPNGNRPSIGKKKLLSNIYKEPLLVDREPSLEHLLVREAGKFREFQQAFQSKLEIAGYADDPVDTAEQFAFIISGEQGTGKSTLASMLVHWLQQCKTPDPWNRIAYPPENTGHRGQGLYEYLAGELDNTAADSYCYVVIDDLKGIEENDAIRVFEDYSRSRILIMFMITSDIHLLHKVDDSYRIDITRYRMESLAPEQAVAFVRQRIAQFREGRLRQTLAAYPLFPFLEADIRMAVAESGNGMHGERGPITLRSLASILHRTLTENLLARQGDADLGTLTAQQIASRIIKPAQAYANLREVAAA